MSYMTGSHHAATYQCYHDLEPNISNPNPRGPIPDSNHFTTVNACFALENIALAIVPSSSPSGRRTRLRSKFWGAQALPQRPLAPAVAGPRAHTEAQKARKKAKRASYKAKKKKRERKCAHHGKGKGKKLATTMAPEEGANAESLGLGEVESDDPEPPQITVPVPDNVPSDQQEVSKMGNYTVSLKPSADDWYKMDKEDREAES
ncbi:uncharacterized protein N7477_001676 [Penicillium maclennaniae]|uniref:uncharacterized protein n=1 Tax=Penicillium maclennaniae TaxID=1343394 RepID=UPI002540FE2D|nr:uncharacterized protein N7477_001676 [Penicillium maclennaniae]KAJ5681736.1 hypothetical protein N7477_001676 [Penicillium maclennaniae]